MSHAGNDNNTTLFKYNDENGKGQIIRITGDTIRRDPTLFTLLEKIKTLPKLEGYGESYEKGGGHDKEHDKSGDHDKSFSRT